MRFISFRDRDRQLQIQDHLPKVPERNARAGTFVAFTEAIKDAQRSLSEDREARNSKTLDKMLQVMEGVERNTGVDDTVFVG